jgi:hypothetical protein
MNIQISPNSFDDFVAFAVLWIVVWLGFLYRILTRADFDVMTRILWVIVVVFVPIFGVGLYLVAAPDAVGERRGAKRGPVNLASDVSGTPWETDSGHTKGG